MENIMRFRHNAMQVNSLSAFTGMKGGVHQNCKDVYFIRFIGTNMALVSDIEQMDYHMTERMEQQPDFVYQRIDRLPALSSASDAAYYETCYQAWIDGQKQRAAAKAFDGNEEYARLLGKGLDTVLELYAAERPQISTSMEKNFVVKMLFWQDVLLNDIIPQWHKQLSIKLVLSNITKQQEYFFAYLLTLLGCDVLLLQNEADISPKEEGLGLSQKVRLGEFQKISIPEYHRVEITVSLRRSSCAAGNTLRANVQSEPHSDVRFSARTGSSADTSGPIVVKIPPRPGTRTSSGLPRSVSAANSPSSEPSRPVNAAKPPSSGSSRPVNAAKPLPSGSPRPAASPSGTPAEKSFEELAQLASSVVLIAIHNQNGDVIGTGSGIMIGKNGYILTNNHVASGGRFYSIRIEDDEKVYSTDELIKYHSTLDLAVLRIDRKLNPLPVYKGRKPLVRGQKVVAIGSPLGLFNSVSDGIISGFRKIDGVDMIQFTAPISRGSSGGAVLNMYGEVIGMSTAGFDLGQNINLAMGYECISQFISGFV